IGPYAEVVGSQTDQASFRRVQRRSCRVRKTGFRRAALLAGLSGNVTPHTLRHTAATWLMQSGTDRWQAAGYLGMSVEMLEKVYGHHHPDYLQAAVAAIGNGSRTKQEQRKTVSVGIAVGAQKTL